MKAKEYSRFELKFRNIKYNTYVLFEKPALFSDSKWYIEIYGRNGESHYFRNSRDEWELYRFSGDVLNTIMPRYLTQEAYRYMKSEDFLNKIELLKGCEMSYMIMSDVCYHYYDINNKILLNPAKEEYKLITDPIIYKSQKWKFVYAYIEPIINQDRRTSDNIVIYIENIESGKREMISFESIWFRVCFLKYWALYLWVQFYFEPDYYHRPGHFGVFGKLEDHMKYYKWMEDNEFVSVSPFASI